MKRRDALKRLALGLLGAPAVVQALEPVAEESIWKALGPEFEEGKMMYFMDSDSAFYGRPFMEDLEDLQREKNVELARRLEGLT